MTTIQPGREDPRMRPSRGTQGQAVILAANPAISLDKTASRRSSQVEENIRKSDRKHSPPGGHPAHAGMNGPKSQFLQTPKKPGHPQGRAPDDGTLTPTGTPG